MPRATINEVHILARAEGMNIAIGGTKGDKPCALTDFRIVGRWNETKWIHPIGDIKDLDVALECAFEWLLCKPEASL